MIVNTYIFNRTFANYYPNNWDEILNRLKNDTMNLIASLFNLFLLVILLYLIN